MVPEQSWLVQDQNLTGRCHWKLQADPGACHGAAGAPHAPSGAGASLLQTPFSQPQADRGMEAVNQKNMPTLLFLREHQVKMLQRQEAILRKKAASASIGWLVILRHKQHESHC